ncbi:MAG: hypothetical protein JNM94_14255 [Phycisphaerae bacterium]|nr:hypothetical protein [Phycisphaerae bacterium]
MKVTHQFVEFVPEQLQDGVLYVSVVYATVAHKCCCGCGYEVVTPLTPTDWKLLFDGETVSLEPSIGNWSFPCESHYWIRRNKVQWAGKWTRQQIQVGRERDAVQKRRYLQAAEQPGTAAKVAAPPKPSVPPSSFWRTLARRFRGR